MSPRVTTALCLLALAVLPADTTAQETDLFSQAVEVRVVNVDVHVTDRKGRPISGLGREDFVLYLDGREVEISYFRAAEGATGSPPTAAPAPEPAVQSAGPHDPTAATDSREELLVVLYLDNYWLSSADRMRLSDDLEQFVATQTPSTVRYLVATHDPGLHIRSSITSDLDEVLAVLAALPEMPAHGLEMRRERSSTFSAIQSIYQVYEGAPSCADPCDCAWEQMVAVWESLAQSVTHRMAVSAGGLSDLLAALSGMADRKAVLYVASGLEQRPALDVLQYLSQLCPQRERDAAARTFLYDESSPLQRLGALANASRTTFYVLDAGGLRGDAAASVEWADAKFRPSGLVTRIERENYQASLDILANETGGRAIFNANQPFEQLRELEDDFYNVYSLGVEPVGAADGKKHTIRVELRDPPKGADLRFRRSFIDRPIEDRLADRAIAAVTFDEVRNPLAVEASLGETAILAPKVISLPVHIIVRPENLTLFPAGSGSAGGRVRVFLAALSAAGERTAIREKFFDLDPTRPATEELRLVVNMNLEPGDYRVAVGVRDEIGGETSFLILDTTDPSDHLVAEAPPAGEG
jgi:VWFA-related protein